MGRKDDRENGSRRRKRDSKKNKPRYNNKHIRKQLEKYENKIKHIELLFHFFK